jgi:hypothetical protein
MANKQSASNQVVRALLTIIGQQRDLDVLGLAPSSLQGKKIRAALIEEFENRCAYCDVKLVASNSDIDHLVPMNKSSVGLHMYGNLVPSCKPCNRDKHSSSVEEFATKFPGRVSALNLKKLTSRARDFGADLDTQPLRDFAEDLYASIAVLLEQKKREALRILPSPRKPSTAVLNTVQRKADYDFSDIAQQFPLGSVVSAKKDGASGIVYDYSLEGAIGKRMPYVRFETLDGSRKLTRSPNQLTVITQ